ncbi:MAG: hypothetical protein HQK76_17725 [Desulfobacterales bacterium]|nr:hypothetical protein [Desulfobacterales bacterium]
MARKLFLLASCIIMFFLAACGGPKPIKPEAQLDTPEHHVSNGYKMLKAGELEKAFSSFERATKLDPKYAPGYAGLGLVYCEQANYKKAKESFDKAEGYAKSDAHKFDVYIGYIRLYTLGGKKVDDDWLDEAESYHKKARKIFPDRPESYFYMGNAYKMAYKFNEASGQYAKVLQLNREFVGEADKEFALIQKIQRAIPGTEIGKKIALVEKINRADVAALFIQELKLDELFKARTKKEFDNSYKSPEKKFETGSYVAAQKAVDIDNHVLKLDIEAVMEVGVRGLQPGPDHKYYPDTTIKRAEFALMIEDILIKITGNEKLATQFIGSESPFPDLRNDLAFFNAVMVCTARGLMQTKDIETAEFGPLDTVSGADALLTIRTLKNQLEKR